MTLRTIGAVLVLAAVPFAQGSARAQDAPADFGGYQARASGEAFSIRPTLPALLPTDVPFEATISHALATLSSGGQGFGRASTLYPGSLVAGLRPLLGQTGIDVPLPDYPIVVESRAHQDRTTDDLQGVNMISDIDPDRAEVTSDIGGFSIPAIIDVGSIETVSRLTVGGGELVSESVSTVSRIDLLEGALRIGAITSTSRVTTDGQQSVCEGSIEIGGVRLAGFAATIDEAGIHLDGNRLLPLVNLDQLLNQLLGAAGIEIGVLESFDGCEGAAGSRTTGGLRITVAIPEIRPIPPGARLDITFASTNASANASMPFEIPDAEPPATGGTPVPASPGGSAPTVGSGTVDVPSEPPSAPEVTPTTTTPLPPAERTSYTSDGVPVPLAVGLMLLAVPGATRIRRYLERLIAMTTGATP